VDLRHRKWTSIPTDNNDVGSKTAKLAVESCVDVKIKIEQRAADRRTEGQRHEDDQRATQSHRGRASQDHQRHPCARHRPSPRSASAGSERKVCMIDAVLPANVTTAAMSQTIGSSTGRSSMPEAKTFSAIRCARKPPRAKPSEPPIKASRAASAKNRVAI